MPSMILKNSLMFIILLCATLIDVRTRKIYNWLTFPGMLLGLLYNGFFWEGHLSGLWFGVQGMLLGMAIFFIPFALGGLGAGDVKLLMMVGAFSGSPFVVKTALCAALAGGFLALIVILLSKTRAKQSMDLVRELCLKLIYQLPGPGLDNVKTSGRRFPYSLAILCGAIAALFLKF